MYPIGLWFYFSLATTMCGKVQHELYIFVAKWLIDKPSQLNLTVDIPDDIPDDIPELKNGEYSI